MHIFTTLTHGICVTVNWVYRVTDEWQKLHSRPQGDTKLPVDMYQIPQAELEKALISTMEKTIKDAKLTKLIQP
jgi:hypothetical protein